MGVITAIMFKNNDLVASLVLEPNVFRLSHIKLLHLMLMDRGFLLITVGFTTYYVSISPLLGFLQSVVWETSGSVIPLPFSVYPCPTRIAIFAYFAPNLHKHYYNYRPSIAKLIETRGSIISINPINCCW
jgi:hypothetical protein